MEVFFYAVLETGTKSHNMVAKPNTQEAITERENISNTNGLEIKSTGDEENKRMRDEERQRRHGKTIENEHT